MNLTTGILAVAMMTGAAWGQNPDAIDNARSTMKSLQQKQANDSNAALNAAGVPAQGQTHRPASAANAHPHDPMKPRVAGAMIAQKKAAQPPVVSIVNAERKPVVEIKNVGMSKPPDPTKQAKPEDKKWAMTGKRDPFFSPVVQQPTGSGCSTGKKCLEIGQINVRGVVKADSGFIAVVTNSLNKAYFLRENDPVFNGYVVRITGDTVVFQETVQDKLGKPFTREITKRILTPAV